MDIPLLLCLLFFLSSSAIISPNSIPNPYSSSSQIPDNFTQLASPSGVLYQQALKQLLSSNLRLNISDIVKVQVDARYYRFSFRDRNGIKQEYVVEVDKEEQEGQEIKNNGSDGSSGRGDGSSGRGDGSSTRGDNRIAEYNQGNETVFDKQIRQKGVIITRAFANEQLTRM